MIEMPTVFVLYLNDVFNTYFTLIIQRRFKRSIWEQNGHGRSSHLNFFLLFIMFMKLQLNSDNKYPLGKQNLVLTQGTG